MTYSIQLYFPIKIRVSHQDNKNLQLTTAVIFFLINDLLLISKEFISFHNRQIQKIWDNNINVHRFKTHLLKSFTLILFSKNKYILGIIVSRFFKLANRGNNYDESNNELIFIRAKANVKFRQCKITCTVNCAIHQNFLRAIHHFFSSVGKILFRNRFFFLQERYSVLNF